MGCTRGEFSLTKQLIYFFSTGQSAVLSLFPLSPKLLCCALLSRSSILARHGGLRHHMCSCIHDGNSTHCYYLEAARPIIRLTLKGVFASGVAISDELQFESFARIGKKSSAVYEWVVQFSYWILGVFLLWHGSWMELIEYARAQRSEREKLASLVVSCEKCFSKSQTATFMLSNFHATPLRGGGVLCQSETWKCLSGAKSANLHASRFEGIFHRN